MCGKDQTPLRKGLSEVRNSRGHGIDLVGDCCWEKAQVLVDELASLYGAEILPGRTYRCSPMGTPDVRSFDELRRAIVEARERITNHGTHL